jgi:hypothetical protein
MEKVQVTRHISRPFRVCPACGGSLQDSLDDPGWVKCFSCSRSFDAQAIAGASTVTAPSPADPDGLSMMLSDGRRRVVEQLGPPVHRKYVRRVVP